MFFFSFLLLTKIPKIFGSRNIPVLLTEIFKNQSRLAFLLTTINVFDPISVRFYGWGWFFYFKNL